MEEAYYVNIREPNETRRRLLETSREVVLALQKYEGFKLKNNKKQDFVNLLRKNFKEINELIIRLKKELPQVKVKKAPTLEIKRSAPVKVSKAKGALTDLERELNDIESKLKDLR